MTDHSAVFLSYSRNDQEAAAALREQLSRHGLSVFKDDESIRGGDLWLNHLQEAVDGCGSFVVLIGRDGVRRWIGAETQVALSRHFGPHDDAERLPIFPILLGDTPADSLPAFLRLFQATAWDGNAALSASLLDHIRERTLPASRGAVFEGCPFVGLDAFRIDQAQLFFGRQKETLDALACFDTRRGSPTVRWLEINGNSGSGKSSLMNAGLLPLVDQGWLWPRTRIEHWRRIGPMMPGEHPVRMLAEQLARSFGQEMADVRHRLDADDLALAEWLRGRKEPESAFLLALDQFEELFTFADPEERGRFDRLLGAALDDADCPLFVISTVRADFLDRYEDLPRLLAVRNRLCRPWTLPPIGADGLREVIGGPARLAGLDVSEVQEAMVDQAGDEPGALPLVENALHWLWDKRDDGRLSGRLFTEQGGLAGILSHSADALLDSLGPQRQRALELLFRLVKMDPDGRRHTRRRISLAEAVSAAGGGERGRRLVYRLAGERAVDGGSAHGPLRLVTVTKVAADEQDGGDATVWVNLIHETLIRRQTPEPGEQGQPFWPTLWDYMERNKDRAARREKLQLLARLWRERRGIRRLFGLSGWWGLIGFRGLATPGSVEQRYLRWSAARSSLFAAVLVALLGLAAESWLWTIKYELPLEAVSTRWAYKLGKDLPFPGLVRIPPTDAGMGTGAQAGTEPVSGEVPSDLDAPFYLGATEVTFAEYRTFATAVGRRIPSDEGWEGDDRPVINVGWDDAAAYARWLNAMTGAGCRLPSQWEWEHACRADTTTEYGVPAPAGSDDIAGRNLANCRNCGSQWDGQQTAPAKQFAPNAWGVHDMHGNVREWAANCYEHSPDQWQADLEDPDPSCGRALRGGSWASYASNARCAGRFRDFPDYRINDIGFRVLCSSPISDH